MTQAMPAHGFDVIALHSAAVLIGEADVAVGVGLARVSRTALWGDFFADDGED